MNEVNMATDPNARLGWMHHKCVSWSAIILGALVGVGLSFLINLFGLAIGLTAFVTKDDTTSLAIGGFVGLIIGGVAAMFVAGWVSGYLARPACPKRHLGELYGFATWCLTLVFSIWLATGISDFVNRANYTVNPHGQSVMTTVNPNAPSATTAAGGTEGSQVTVNTANTVNPISVSIFATFFLFFIGALASAFGGRCGMRSRCDSIDSCYK